MTLKSVTIDPKIAPDLLAPVHHATAELEDILGDAAERIDVTWTPGIPDVKSVMLSLSDTGVEKRQEFTMSNFKEGFLLRHSLRWLWNAVLAERMRLQWDRVLASLADSGEG